MGLKEDIKRLESQISKKKKEKEKISTQLVELKSKEEILNKELEKLENRCIRATLEYNNMTFDEFIQLISQEN